MTVLTCLRIVRCPTVVYNCNVAPRLHCTGSNDIFPRSVTAKGDSSPPRFKKKNPKESNCFATYGLLPRFIFYHSQLTRMKTLNSSRYGSSLERKLLHSRRVALSRRSLCPVASSHRDVGGGECNPTRKDLCFTHMWTGF